MEGSLRDRVEALVDAGMTEEAAFREAVRRVGSYGTADVEYRKVYWGKLKRRRQLFNEFSWRFSMLRNYLKVASRNLLRRKGYVVINVSGLAIGLASCLLIGMYVRYERSYDRYHVHFERIYRVVHSFGTAEPSETGVPHSTSA